MVEPLAGAVLAGGVSRRMGTDKAMVEIDGVPMIDRVIGALAEAGVDPLVQVGGIPRGSRVPLDVVADAAVGAGPLAGVVAALRWSPHAHVAILACDLPYLTSRVIYALQNALDDQTDVVVAHTDRLEPLCAVWRVATCIDEAQRVLASDRHAVHEVFGALAVASVSVPMATLHNVNTPGDVLRR